LYDRVSFGILEGHDVGHKPGCRLTLGRLSWVDDAQNIVSFIDPNLSASF